MEGSKRSAVVLWVVGALWYANLVTLIVANSEYPGSHQLRDYKQLIGIVFVVITGCFLQTYAIWKKAQPHVNDDY